MGGPLGAQAAASTPTREAELPSALGLGTAASRLMSEAIPCRLTASKPTRQGTGLKPPNSHVGLRRGGPPAVLSASKVARNELLMGRRQPAIPC